MNDASAAVSPGPWIELGTERESLLKVLDEDPYFGRQPAACRSNRKDRLSSFVRSQKTYNRPSLSSAANSHACAWASLTCFSFMFRSPLSRSRPSDFHSAQPARVVVSVAGRVVAG
jgi:hypothetical protein